MIKSIVLKNFFSFRDVTIELKQLNVLVGINGVGKSNFIKSLRLLRATIIDGSLTDLIMNQWGGFDAMCFAGGNNTETSSVIELEFQFDFETLHKYGYSFQEPIYYKIAFKKVASTQNYSLSEMLYTKSSNGRCAYWYFKMKDGKGYAREGRKTEQHSVNYQLDNTTESLFGQVMDKDRYYQIYTLREAIKDISVYGYFDTTAQSSIRKPMLPIAAIRLAFDGGNLPQILNRIKITSKKNYNSIIKSLCSINPNYRDIDFNIIGNNIELMLDEKGLDRSVHVTHISDGTLRYLCLLSIICNSQRGALVCIDEPEMGLHPDMINEIVENIQDAASGTQFVISTHSEHILNNISVDDVLVCEKDKDNSTVINTFRDAEFVEWASKYTTGNLWRNGDLGGNVY